MAKKIKSKKINDLLIFTGPSDPASTALQPGRFDRGSLSMFHPSTIHYDGVTLPTLEHWLMYAKAGLFQDQQAADAVLRAATPEQARRIGQQISGYDHQVWLDAAPRFAMLGNVLKFTQNPQLGLWLIDTEGLTIGQANDHDMFWGTGLSAKESKRTHPALWPGTNHAGRALMSAREIITVLRDWLEGQIH